MSLVRWFRYFMWKYFNKNPKIETVDDLRFWDNKMFKIHRKKEHEGEAHEDDKFIH